jgi:hypothetical protein
VVAGRMDDSRRASSGLSSSSARERPCAPRPELRSARHLCERQNAATAASAACLALCDTLLTQVLGGTSIRIAGALAAATTSMKRGAPAPASMRFRRTRPLFFLPLSPPNRCVTRPSCLASPRVRLVASARRVGCVITGSRCWSSGCAGSSRPLVPLLLVPSERRGQRWRNARASVKPAICEARTMILCASVQVFRAE